MRLLKLTLLCVLLACLLPAAPWDGPRGPVSAFTFTQPGYLPGVFGSPATALNSLTVMWLSCTDQTVSGIRVSFTYHDSNGDHQGAFLSSIINGRGILVTAIQQDQIAPDSVKFTVMHDGETY